MPAPSAATRPQRPISQRSDFPGVMIARPGELARPGSRAARLRGAPAGVPLFTEWGLGNRDLRANWQRARKWLIANAPSKREAAELDATLPRSMTFNHLRRTFCSQMRNAGVSLDDCAKLLGHEDRTMVELVYGVTAMATLHRAVTKLPAMALPPERLPQSPRAVAPAQASPARRTKGRGCRSGHTTGMSAYRGD